MNEKLHFQTLPKLKAGDKVAILSPSYAAPAAWPHIYELGLKRLREEFLLEPVSFPATAKLGASKEERAADLIAAFADPTIKAVIATLGGDDQITYVKNLPDEPFRSNPKMVFGYSDNTHFMNHLWLNGVPSFYGGALFTQFAQTPQIEDFTLRYLKKALFRGGETELDWSKDYNDVGLGWDDPANMNRAKLYEPNDGWTWDGETNAQGYTWGGCLESIDEILRHNGRLPSPEQFEQIVLVTETSEEIPDHDYTRRIFRALGERGILERVKAFLVGRPKAWEFGREKSTLEKAEYRKQQQQTILATVRAYNSSAPIVQNLDFGHTNPQICLPLGASTTVDSSTRTISICF